MDLVECGLSEQDARDLMEKRRQIPLFCEKVGQWSAQGIEVVSVEDPRFPEKEAPALLHASMPVHLLFASGNPELMKSPCVAVVGSRKAGEYGLAAAKEMAGGIAQYGYTIVSGMAGGIDTAAHMAALQAGGNTIAVLGCGVDVCYPAANRALYRDLLEKGLILSEFEPGTIPRNYNFPLRNRIIAGLSRAVIVAEAAKNSGSLITVNHALEMGVPVFAVPGSIFEKNCIGTNQLIFDGAGIAVSWKDVVYAVEGVAIGENAASISFEDPEMKAVWNTLSLLPQSIYEICTQFHALYGKNIEAFHLLRILSKLEAEGYIVRTADGCYGKK